MGDESQEQDGTESHRPKTLPSDLQARLGFKLRQAYRAPTDEPVPDRFAELLDRLSKIRRD